ncbi:hypothetical protein [Aquamicrobium zhengzhouense]|uniref:DUF982 domain-containing protein n=1 Tax=Aquamicrobium zhengzhouense TaxID=2781738 RepID=A0ABS0SCH4_9HYPH|nr:hypothetical protein [Aquamicrobium zhengzhouense]MBI1620123.1 hypothetical protein [Aquamicrobium zhengzhouense]
MKVTINFRPLDRETLMLVATVHDHEQDPVAAYSRLMSAAMMAAAIIELTPAQVAEQAELFAAQAARAVRERPDIFGNHGVAIERSH